MIVPIKDIDAFGVIKDVPFNEAPMNAWTDARNIRFLDNKAVKFVGHLEVMASPLWSPYWLFPLQRASDFLWAYASASKVGATDGVSHADITRAAGGDYTTDLDVGWTAGVVEEIPVFTNGADVPQMWNPAALATKLQALTAWDATWRANTMRALKRYLIAMDVTKGATRYPNMIKWSDQAPTGGVPTSWDAADETIDAGEWVLPGEGGYIIDGCALRDLMVIYKETQVWLMSYVGGIDVFRFTKKFGEFGMLARRNAVEFFSGKHFVNTGDDLVLHDGQEAKSLLTGRARGLLRGAIDSTYYSRSFVIANYPKTEVWACFPEEGQSACTKAIVWNWITNAIGVRDLPAVGFAAPGIINPPGLTWTNVSGTWATITGAWGDRVFNPSSRHILFGIPGSTQLMQADQTNQNNGTDMTSYLEKQLVGFPLTEGAPPNFTRMKQIRGLYPRISGTPGGVVNVYVAKQTYGTDPVYGAARPYTIGTTDFIDTSDVEASRLHAIKFESTTDIAWALENYDVDVIDRGMNG